MSSVPQCSVCRSAKRAELEEILLTGTMSVRALAREHGVSRDALRRHVARHVDIADRERMAGVSGAAPTDIVLALLDVAQYAYDVRDDAERRDDTKTALAANRQYGQAVDALATRVGLSRAEILAEFDDAEAIVHAVARASQESPAMAERLAVALREQGDTALARSIESYADRQRDALTTGHPA
jgi:transposase-like protein